MNNYILDIETDGLIEEVTKIHCLSYTDGRTKKTLYTREDITSFFNKNRDSFFIGHNIIQYDFPVLKKLYGIERPKRVIDTLHICYYLYPKLQTPGLKFWGEHFKIPKVEVEDWKEGGIELITARCERDVEINALLWIKQKKQLEAIYEDYNPLVKYLTFKADCIREQEENPVKLDIEYIKKTIIELKEEFEKKVEEISTFLPSIEEKGHKTYKNCIFNGTEYITKKYKEEYEDLLEKGYPVIPSIRVEYVKRLAEPNGNSVSQIKDYLFSIGWKPSWYKTFEKKNGESSKVPQIGKENGKSGELCQSIVDLFEIQPGLKALESKGVIQHRIGVLKGFLRDQKNGYLTGSIHGYTNTLRLRHKGIVNLVGHPKPYWKTIRGSFICEEDEVIIGADLSGLESSTQHHYMYYYDPEYVNKIRVKGYDPHLELGLLGGLITQEEAIHYKSGIEDELYSKIKAKRHIAKTSNFALTYGAFPPKIASTAKIKLTEAKNLYESYWALNKSIIDATKDFQTKMVNGTLWVLNPISKLWYHVKSEKDIFNTVNQSSGAFVFDLWLSYVRMSGLIVRMQYHDELLCVVKKKDVDAAMLKIRDAIDKTNQKLKLNIKIDCEIKTGKNYSETH